MSDLFVLDDNIRTIVNAGIDSLIHQLGKQCKLIYTGEKQVCNNCIFDSQNNRSTNKYNGTGPKPFTGGHCPVCGGSGYLPGTVHEEIIQMIVNSQPQMWLYVAGTMETPHSIVQTKGFYADLGKVLQAEYAVLDYKNTDFMNNRYKLRGEPVIQGNISKIPYFMAYWEKIGE